MFETLIFICLALFVAVPLVAALTGHGTSATETGRRCNVLGDAVEGEKPGCWIVRAVTSKGYLLTHQSTGEHVEIRRLYVY